MLQLKRLKLFSLCPLLLALVSCGKKVADGTTLEQGQTGIATSPDIVLETSLVNSSRTNAVYEIEHTGSLFLSASIKATEGSAAGYSLKVFVNRVGNNWEFYCSYKGVTSTGKNLYTLERCYDIDGRDLGLSASNIASFSFPLDNGKTLEMSMSGAASNTKVSAQAKFRAEWN